MYLGSTASGTAARVDQTNCHPERLQRVDPIHGLIGTKCRLIMKDAVASANHVHAIWVSSSSATVCVTRLLLSIVTEGMLIDTRYSFTRVEWERSETQDLESPVGLFRKPGWEQYHWYLRANTDDPDTDRKRLLWKHRDGAKPVVSIVSNTNASPWQYPVAVPRSNTP